MQNSEKYSREKGIESRKEGKRQTKDPIDCSLRSDLLLFCSATLKIVNTCTQCVNVLISGDDDSELRRPRHGRPVSWDLVESGAQHPAKSLESRTSQVGYAKRRTCLNGSRGPSGQPAGSLKGRLER